MKKLVVLLALVALPLVGCSHGSSDASGDVSKDWTERRDTFVKDSQAKLDDLASQVEDLERNGKLVNQKDAKKAREEAKEVKEEIAELRKELVEEANDASAGDWEKERLELVSELNEVEQEFAELKSLYR